MSEPTEFLRVSYSSLNTHSSCERKFEFNKLYPRKDGFNSSYAGDVGTALHKGYQDYLIHGDEDKALWEMASAYPYELEFYQDKEDRNLEACTSTLMEMIESSALEEYELAEIVRPLTDAEKIDLNLAQAEGRLLDYTEAGRVVPAIEVPFEIRFKNLVLPDGRGVAFVGFMDAIMRNKWNDQYLTMDIKTHRRTLKDATASYLYSAQQVPYGIMIEHILGKSVELFDVLYYDCFVDLMNPRCTPYQYEKDSTDIQEWLTNTVLTLQRIQQSMEMDYFPRTGGGCLSFNSACYFLDICQSRNKQMIEAYLLEGEEPAPPRYEVPWILAEIDVFGGVES